MKVIIIKPFQNYKVNQIVEVSDGYGKNFLIKQGYAQPVNKQTIANLDRVMEYIQINKQHEIEKAQAFKEELEKLILKFSLKSNGNIVHGNITPTAIEKELQKLNLKVPKNSLEKINLNTFGLHYVEVKLLPEVIAKLKVEIIEEK